MPPALETRLALSALPAALRSDATVYLLDPAKGYHLSRAGGSGITCIVQRTAWELRDFRDDIFIPLCYDAEGTKTYLKSIMDAAALRAGGMGPAELYADCQERLENPQKDEECKTDADCGTAGCGNEVCTTAAEKGNINTTCEDKLCFKILDACGCHEGDWHIPVSHLAAPLQLALPRFPVSSVRVAETRQRRLVRDKR